MRQDDERGGPSAPLPPFHDDLVAAQAELWRLLADGVAHGRSPFHTPSLATVDGQGRPRARTVVLRMVDAEAGLLRFHCDRRSDKAAELARHASCALHAYDRQAKVQIRIEGRASLHTFDATAEAAWAGSRAMSRVCYGIDPRPGTGLAAGGAYAVPDEAEAPTVGRPNFCAVAVEAEALDFLYLDRRGHRRAAWRRERDGWTGTWLVP
ncbi:pyridoxamine 5'-phosphate oxidase family protein [uncultured Methylobacterium sp.]|uniref:pyridoxamine 5'-phosphate oxidase family protein n=1 Tax=uncultured Methylobacterium sp. TaxID=157278 RepID=UPI0035CB2A3F